MSELLLSTGPFLTRLATDLPQLIDDIARLYAGHERPTGAAFADFHVSVTAPLARRWLRPQVKLAVDGVAPFTPMPREHALPMLEWGLNWCVGNYANQYLVLHAAAVERDGRAIVMPGMPGSGKSTLTAALVHRGWRLLSDELCLVGLYGAAKGLVFGLARPVSLKNESIGVIRDYAPQASLSRPFHDTAKGTIAFLKPPPDSVARVHQPARPSWIIYPKHLDGLPAVLERKPRAAILIETAKHAFNWRPHGARGFEALADLVEACHGYRFTYAALDEAVEIFARLEPPDRLAA